MKSLLLLAGALLLATSSQAQLYVYHVRGEAYVAARQPVPLRPRAAVQPAQALLLKPGAQVILLNKQGRNITFTKPGKASYADLQQAFAASTAGPGQAYLAYVWESLHKNSGAATHGNAPVGGVSRGSAAELLAPTSMPELQAPADLAVLSQPVVAFRWQAPEGPSWFTLTDASGAPLLQVSLSAAALDLNTALTRLQRNEVYYWSVAAAPEQAADAPRRAFVLVAADAARLVTEEAAALPATAEAEWQQALRAGWLFQQATRR